MKKAGLLIVILILAFLGDIAWTQYLDHRERQDTKAATELTLKLMNAEKAKQRDANGKAPDTKPEPGQEAKGKAAEPR